jgi:molybdopterin converting factor small subunit
MATVHLPSGLTQFTGGLAVVDVDGTRVLDVLTALARRFPELEPQLELMAVAVDGEIYQDAGYQPVRTGSDVHLVPRIAGG